MKKLSLVVLSLTFSMISLAQAGQLAERAQNIADRVASAERNLGGRDADDIRYALDQINYLLQRYDRFQNSDSQVSCISNGQQSVWEKFSITDLRTNKKMGGETSKETCQDLIRTQTKGLICLSNGQQSVWEKFTVTAVDSQAKLGGETALETCKTLIKAAKRSFICVSNGQQNVWEKFVLVNRENNARIGGETSLENCLATIPR
jgi:hypothetical protein